MTTKSLGMVRRGATCNTTLMIQSLGRNIAPHQHITRSFTTTALNSDVLKTPTSPEPTTLPTPPTPSPRWLSSLKSRLGALTHHRLEPAHLSRTAALTSHLSHNWRHLLASSEGYLSPGLIRQRVVWGDMDCMSHVNNVTYNKWAESGRIEWANELACEEQDRERREQWRELWSSRGVGMILRSIRTDYKFPMTWPDRVTVFHKLRDEPVENMDSFVLDVMIVSERSQRPAARCVEDIVVYDYKKGKKTVLRPWMVERWRECWSRQEEMREWGVREIAELERKVGELEREVLGK